MLKPILLVEDNPKDLELTLVALGKSQLANEVVVARDDPGQAAWGALRGEASALGRLSHPHVVQIYEAGERDRQLFYNAVEWVEGPTLAKFVGAEPPTHRQAARLVETLARAVQYAHEQGVVNRALRHAASSSRDTRDLTLTPYEFICKAWTLSQNSSLSTRSSKCRD